MNKIKLEIWGRMFELDVVYHNFPGEEVTANQVQTRDLIQSVDFSESLITLNKYILTYYKDNLGADYVDNIFKYVIPKSVLVMRNNDIRGFALLCMFKFDIEHGIAVVFENEQLKNIGPTDIVL